DVAVLVAADTIGEARLAVERHFGKGFAIFELVAVHVVHPDDAFGIGVVRFPSIGDVDLLVIGAETHAIRLERLLRDFGYLTALGVDPIHGFFDERLHIVRAIACAFVVHERTIAGVGEPDGAIVRMHHAIVRGVELFALIVLGGEDGDAAIVFVPAHI